MDKINVAFDIDGTLRSSKRKYAHRDTSRIVWNEDVCNLAHTLSRFKNIRCYIWSGGGQKYAEQVMREYQDKYGKTFVRALAKFDPTVPRMDIAVDDIQECNLGVINLIVRQK